MALEKQIHVGDFVYGTAFGTTDGGGEPAIVNSGVVDQYTLRVKRTQEEFKYYGERDIHSIKDRYFDFKLKWLPWADTKINYCAAQGSDVLSGMFSGCWMARYMDSDWRVCHINTSKDGGDCKDLWRQTKAKLNSEKIKEFAPDAHTNSPLTLGLVTSTGDLFAIKLKVVADVQIRNPWRTKTEWKDPAKGNQKVDAFAEACAGQSQINASTVFHTSSYRIESIVGPLPSSPFPQ